MPAEYDFEFVKNEIIPSFPNFKLWGDGPNEEFETKGQGSDRDGSGIGFNNQIKNKNKQEGDIFFVERRIRKSIANQKFLDNASNLPQIHMPGKKSGYLSHGERVCCKSTNHISILQSIKPGLEAEEIISMINDFLNEMNSLQHISEEGSENKEETPSNNLLEIYNRIREETLEEIKNKKVLENDSDEFQPNYDFKKFIEMDFKKLIERQDFDDIREYYRNLPNTHVSFIGTKEHFSSKKKPSEEE